MKIGCISSKGNSVEPVNLSVIKETVYELEIVVVKHPRHYPRYSIDTSTIAYASSREEAENLMKEAISSGKWKKDDIFCFNIYKRPIDFEYSWGDYMASWLYSQDGILLDKRLFPTFWAERGFDGRSADEVRFKYGDLVECRFGATIELVYVVATPPDKSHYERISKEHGEPYFGDDSDDSYIVVDGPSYDYHNHIDALHLYTPHFKIPKHIFRKYEKIWEGFLKDEEEYKNS